ncbi:MFS transporter [Sphaerisporangium siamense]|uniref:Putative MFS family arabinose efflux permease n=1 Tax=Sphaerisporangium siamense TaxID=795645 RepID=A0A7W7G9B8_9ACTN|nr:MFS transporter [Sphaerisporangium siamense]MBB4700435.1 putative MFS family arabinose efflux permease [Sphaerisporangium siamense]GII88403.1 MFS transporter [Sphaerisporangium siamense]
MSSTAVVRSLTRDRPTWLIYFQLCIFATYLYGLSAALPLLRLDQGVSQAVAGLHGTAMAAGGVTSGLAMPRVMARLGRRLTTWIGTAAMTFGVTLVALTPALPVTLLGYGLASAGGSIALYAGMSVLSDHHGVAGPAAINEANAVGVTVGIGVSYLISALAPTPLGWRAGILVTPVAALLLLALMGRVWIPRDTSAGRASAREVPTGPKVPYDWRFHTACGVLFCLVAMEFLFNMWAARLLADRTGMTAAAAATGLTAFTVGVAAGRFAAGRLTLRFDPTPLLTCALFVTLTGWAVFWLGDTPALCYAGLVLSGVGAAVQFPLGLARVIASSGGRAAEASAAASVWASTATGVGPFALGALADGFGTHTAFLIVPLLIFCAVCGIAVSSWRAAEARPPAP